MTGAGQFKEARRRSWVERAPKDGINHAGRRSYAAPPAGALGSDAASVRRWHRWRGSSLKLCQRRLAVAFPEAGPNGISGPAPST